MRRVRRGPIVALGWVSRLLGVGVSLLMVRIALHILGESQFAVFQILTSALAWMSLSSLGLGPALKNLIAEHGARGESDVALRATSAVLIVVLFVVGVALVVAMAPSVTGGLLRKLSHDELWATRAFLAGGILSLAAALGQIGTEVLYAEFRGHWVYILSILGSLLTLGFLTRLEHLRYSPSELVFWTVCATIGPQAVSGVAGLVMTRMLVPGVGVPSRDVVHQISRLAVRFWGFAILSNFILLVDYLVISQILVAREIVVYSIMMKITTVGLVLFTTVIAVTWPEWTHHWELRQWSQLRRSVLTLAVIGVAACVPVAIVAVYVLPAVLRLWLGDALVLPSRGLVVAFAGYLAVRLWTDVHSSALMAGNRVASATAFAIVQAAITAPLEYVFGRRWGAEGVIVGLLVGFLATTAWMFPRRLYGELRVLSLVGRVSKSERGTA